MTTTQISVSCSATSSPTSGIRRSQLRKDHELVPLNSDFDLYSLGPDGISALALPAAPSQDDVVRAANGAYIGLGANY